MYNFKYLISDKIYLKNLNRFKNLIKDFFLLLPKNNKMTNNCQLYIIGRNYNKEVIPNVHKKFPDMECLNPKSEMEIINFIKNIANKTIKSKSTAILYISAHGNNELKKLTFDNLSISPLIISENLKRIRNIYNNFRINLMIDSCFSGNFDGSSCDALITSCDKNSCSVGELIIRGFDEILSKNNEFSLRKIFDCCRFNSDVEKQSNTVNISMAWGIIDNENSNFSIQNCDPFVSGNIDEILKPIIDRRLINKGINMAEKEYKTTILESSQILGCINEISEIKICESDFYPSMMLRQLGFYYKDQ